jgi:hypothetical protein
MNSILRKTAMASALAIAAMAFSNVSIAQDTDNPMPKKCIGEACPGQGGGQGANSSDQDIPADNDQMKKLRKKNMQPNDQVQDMQNGDDQGGSPDQMRKLRKKKGTQSTEQYQDNNDNDQMLPGKKKMSQSNWHFDSGKHHRRRSKDAIFRFYFGGYWYDQPYWQEDYYVDSGYGYGISCRQGRNIVAARFNRVRVVECRGRAYTYIGRRHGDDYQVVLSSRSGRILNVDEL